MRSKLPNILQQIFLYVVYILCEVLNLPNQRWRNIFCITLNIHSHQHYLVTRRIYNNDSLRIVGAKDHKYTWNNNAVFNGVFYRKAKETTNRGKQIFPDKENRCRNQVTKGQVSNSECLWRSWRKKLKWRSEEM